jgi:hypothetical protein
MNATTTDPDGARVDRSPLWILFFLFGALLGAHAIYLMVLPSADPDHWRAFTSDPEMIAYRPTTSGHPARCSSDSPTCR